MMIIGIHPLHVLVVVIFLLCMKTSSKDDKMIMCIKKERDALLVYKQDVGVTDRRDTLHSWKNEEEDCCKWIGVGCDNHTGHVTHLHLSRNSLYYINLSNVSIGLGQSLIDITYLKYLDLSRNKLSGLTIAKFIGSLTNLVHLDLSNAHVVGSIPDQIVNHSNLQYLNLSLTHTNGSIPKFIGRLNSLRHLDLSGCSFTGVIPHELKNLSKLQHLDLSYNYNLTGDRNLEWLFNLSSLTHLDLSYINIANPRIWVSFIQMIPSISIMRLNYCNLSAPYSTLRNFSSSISTLHLQGNKINSSIFDWLCRLNGRLVQLDLSVNLLEGRIPKCFRHMTALTHLDLSVNQLNGVLSKSIDKLSNLEVINFRSNSFTGNLEDVLSGPYPSLQELLISENHLTGSVPDTTLPSSLRKLQVSSNQLNRYLPAVFEHQSALEILDLSNNHLRGRLPNFTGCSSLRVLNLNSNEFSGSLPDFSGCSSLIILRLDENHLTKWKTKSTGLLSSLQELDLSKNSIHSTVSEAHLSNLSSLKYMRASSNSLTFELNFEWLPPFQLLELSLASCKLGRKFPNWIQNQRDINHLDISNSQISDTIPVWFGNLSSILHLNLSSNKVRDQSHVVIAKKLAMMKKIVGTRINPNALNARNLGTCKNIVEIRLKKVSI